MAKKQKDETKKIDMKKRSKHIYDSLCECGHSLIAHRDNGSGVCMEANCCEQFQRDEQ